MMRPLLRPRLPIRRVSGIAERCEFVGQIYGLTATRLAEPVCCGTEEDQNTRRAGDRFSRRPGVRIGFYGASTGVWRAEARGAPSAAISNNSADDSGDEPDANDAD